MGQLNSDQIRILKERAESVIERWQYIKSRCRQDEGRPSNIEKHSPCLAAALNQMEVYLRLLEVELEKEKANNEQIKNEHKRLAQEIPMWGADGD